MGGDKRSEQGVKLTPGSPKTGERLGKEFGVSHKTVIDDGHFAAAVDSIAINVGPEIARDIRSGKADLTKTQVREIGKMQPEHAS